MTTPTFTITIGLESPRLMPEECRALALIAAARYFPSGHTVIEATGRWISERGVIDEPTLVIIVITDDREAVGDFAQAYKVGAFQDCVLIQVTRPETIWV